MSRPLRRPFHERTAGVCLALGLTLALALAAAGADPGSVAARGLIGLELRVERAVAGPELEARPVDPKSPLQLRVAGARPEGAGFRYDFRCIGLEPGRHDLRRYLQHRDGSSISNVPPMEVLIESTLLPVHNGLLLEDAPRPAPRVGGYRWGMGVAGVLWVAGLGWVLTRGRRPAVPRVQPVSAPPATLAGRLQPLVDRITAGTASPAECAQLERILLDHWQARLGMTHHRPEEAIRRLKEHPEAGPMLRALERWLHRPAGEVPENLGQLLSTCHESPDTPGQEAP